MENLLRKLHIGRGSSDGGSSRPPRPSPKRGSGSAGGVVHHHQSQPSAISNWLDSVPTRPPPPVPEEADQVPTSASVGVGAEESRAGYFAAETRRLQQEEVENLEVEEKRVIREAAEAEERKREREREDDLEAYQMQLVLEMSKRENPEAIEIEVAKQLSLGFCPPQASPAEVLTARYWNFNALTYDDKIPDGFYDVFYVGNGPASVTMPSFAELRAQPFSHKVNWEVVLVHRGEDPVLMKLQQEALIMALDLQSRTSESVGNALVKRLACLVARHMGGLFDPESMSMKYQNMLNSLRSSIGSVVVPVGQLKIGLARHRALLFKVLVDSLDVPCRLLKGRQYTGSDDGALNIVKFKDGREFIVDLVADPGTLIPSDGAVLSTDFDENLVTNNHHLKKHETTNVLGSSFSRSSSSAYGSFEYELLDRRSTSSNVGPSDTDGPTTNHQTSNQQSMLSSSFEKLSVSTCTSGNRPIINESTNADYIMVAKSKEKSIAPIDSSSTSPSASDMGSTPAVHRMKVKDISGYMINAAKENPQLAQKIHEVLSENGVVAPCDLFPEDSMEEPKDLIVDDPGTLIPSDGLVLSTESDGNFISDNHHLHKDDTTNLLGSSSNGASSRHDNLEIVLQDQSAEPCDLRLQYLIDITENFSDKREVGRGGFGVVYKGMLPNGAMVAVKNLMSMTEVQDTQFKNEVDNLMRVKHQNIVRFVGYCYETRMKYIKHDGKTIFAEIPQRLLCFEYVPNGSLDRYISDESHGLDWHKRYRIIRGICCGLNYLHEECQINGSIIHLDLKPANIMLDDYTEPKIADFGLSKLFDDQKTRTWATLPLGSLGYMAPEYLFQGIITTKADIYSLGVIIIEIVAGRKISPYDTAESRSDFVELVLKNWRNRLEASPGCTYLEIYSQQIRTCLEIGLSCVRVDRGERPSIREIIEMLNK